MAIPETMTALLVQGDGYTRKPSGTTLEAMQPYVELGTISVPRPGPSQLLIKVRLGAINPSDVACIKGSTASRESKASRRLRGGRRVVGAGADPAAQALVGKRVAFATGLTNWGSWADTRSLRRRRRYRSSTRFATRTARL